MSARWQLSEQEEGAGVHGEGLAGRERGGPPILKADLEMIAAVIYEDHEDGGQGLTSKELSRKVLPGRHDRSLLIKNVRSIPHFLPLQNRDEFRPSTYK